MRTLILLAGLSILLGTYAVPAGPREENVYERDMPITRHGSQLKLNGKPWTASGANVYWLGLVSTSITGASKGINRW
jgi:hypothetical protein